MEIHLSEKFSQIEVVYLQNGSISIQCALWPSWSELFAATENTLTLAQLRELEDLFRAESQAREFEIKDEVLIIRSGQALAI
jgi:hypothetical protein